MPKLARLKKGKTQKSEKHICNNNNVCSEALADNDIIKKCVFLTIRRNNTKAVWAYCNCWLGKDDDDQTIICGSAAAAASCFNYGNQFYAAYVYIFSFARSWHYIWWRLEKATHLMRERESVYHKKAIKHNKDYICCPHRAICVCKALREMT